MSVDLKKPLETETINSIADLAKSEPTQPARRDVVPLDDNTVKPANEPEIPASIDAKNPDNESTISEGIVGFEEVIFTQDVPPTREYLEMRIMLNYASSIVFAFGIGLIALGYFFKEMHDKKSPDFTNILLTGMIIHGFRIFAELLLLCTSAYASQYYNFGIVDSIGSLLVLQAFFFYLNGTYSSDWFINSLIANVPFQFLKTLKKDKNSSPGLNLLLGLLEAISLLFVGKKIATTDVTADWSTVLMFYTAIYYIGMAFIVIAFISIIVVFIAKALNNRSVTSFSGLVLLGILCLYLLLSSAIAASCMLYLGMRKMLEQGMVKPLATGPVDIPLEFELSGYIVIGLGSAMVLGFVIFSAFLRSTILNKFKSGKGKEIIKKVYERTFILKLTAISGKLFKRHPTPEEKANSALVRTDPCAICQINKSTFIFIPCNHCVACDDCIGFFTRTSERCPICAMTIQKLYHINYDEENKGYSIDYSLKIEL